MKAVLFVCHGSRVESSCIEAIDFIDSCKSELQHIPIIESCFLELSSPTIEEGFRRCVEQGATHIGVVPFLLLTAVHALHDIPEELSKVQDAYPHVSVSYGQPIGVSPKMSQILVDKVTDTKADLEDAQVIIVGRGSSMVEVREQLNSIVDGAKEVIPHPSICYLTACTPSFEDSLDEALHADCSTIIVVPYLVFSGILTRTIEKTINTLNVEQKKVIVTEPLCTHHLLKEALLHRVSEVI